MKHAENIDPAGGTCGAGGNAKSIGNGYTPALPRPWRQEGVTSTQRPSWIGITDPETVIFQAAHMWATRQFGHPGYSGLDNLRRVILAEHWMKCGETRLHQQSARGIAAALNDKLQRDARAGRSAE